VLLYQVVKCRNPKGLRLEEPMRDVFDQHTEMDHHGDVRGGRGKLMCLHELELDGIIVRMLVKTPCRKIIKKLRALFLAFYRSVEEEPDSSSTDEDERERDLRVQEAIQFQEVAKKLSSSEWILEMINGYLSSKWDVDDDGSLHKTSVRLKIE
jgi:hypothetical protein